MLTVSITGIDALQHELAKLVPSSENAVIELAERIHELAVAGSEKHNKTHAMTDSLGHGPQKIPGGWWIGINQQRAPYAKFVHWGTRPHPIFPKGSSLSTQRELTGKFSVPKGKKLVLRWTSPGGGGYIFARFVNHPGYKGDPFLVTAATQAIKEFPQMVAKSLKG